MIKQATLTALLAMAFSGCSAKHNEAHKVLLVGTEKNDLETRSATSTGISSEMMTKLTGLSIDEQLIVKRGAKDDEVDFRYSADSPTKRSIVLYNGAACAVLPNNVDPRHLNFSEAVLYKLSVNPVPVKYEGTEKTKNILFKTAAGNYFVVSFDEFKKADDKHPAYNVYSTITTIPKENVK